MTQKLLLYWNIASQPARAVKALLDIGKVPHEQVVIDLSNLIPRLPQTAFFLKINPLGTVPTIKDKNLVISQSSAIMTYLIDSYPNNFPNFYHPTDPTQKAKVNQTISWYQSAFRVPFMEIIKLKIYGKLHKNQSFNQNQIDIANERMQKALEGLEGILSRNGDYVCGDKVSIPDLLFFFELTNYLYYDKSWSHHKKVDDWFKRVYNIGEVKSLTHTWFHGVNEFKKLLNSIKPSNTDTVTPKL